MMVPPLLYKLLLYGSLAAIALSIVWYLARPAVVRGALSRWGPLIGILGGLVVALSTGVASSRVVLVTDDGDHPTARRMVYLGGTPPGATGWNDSLFTSSPTWVVNDSSHTLREVTVEYGQALGFDNGPTEVPPHTTHAFVDIDNIGPDDRPPESVRDEYNLHMDQRLWLTWD